MERGLARMLKTSDFGLALLMATVYLKSIHYHLSSGGFANDILLFTIIYYGSVFRAPGSSGQLCILRTVLLPPLPVDFESIY